MQTQNTGRQTPRGVPKKEDRFRALEGKVVSLRAVSPALLALELAQDGRQEDARWFGGWVAGGQVAS